MQNNYNTDHQGLKREIPLEELCKTKVLSKDACNWVKVAVDPNHDATIKVVGLPDSDTDSSVVVKVEKSFSVTKPDAATGLWDAHFIAQPTVYSELGAGTGSIRVKELNEPPGTMNLTATKRSNVLNPYSVCSVPTGSSTYNSNNGDAIYGGTNYDSFVATSGKKPKYRVIASAMKVTNTTSTLSKQGSVTTYRFDPSHKKENLIVHSDLTFKGRVSVQSIRGPPTTLADAKLFPSSKTWEAAEGAYCVNKLDMSDLTPRSVEASYYMMRSNKESLATGFLSPDEVTEFVPGTTYPDFLNNSGVGKIGGHDTVGAYFNGLSAETTLTFDSTTFLEIFPETDEFMKATAQPSMKSSRNALELYQFVARSMPSGVRAADNDAGSWFRKMAKTAAQSANALSPVLMENPYGAALIAGLNTADKIGDMTKAQPSRRTPQKALKKKK